MAVTHERHINMALKIEEGVTGISSILQKLQRDKKTGAT